VATDENVFSMFDERYGGSQFSDIPRVVRSIERDVVALCERYIVGTFSGAPTRDVPDYVFLKSARYKVTVVLDGQNPRQLNVDVIPLGRGIDSISFFSESIAVSSRGTIDRVKITATPEVHHHLKPHLNQLEIIVRSSYQWAIEKVATCVRRSRTPLEAELMSTLRRKLVVENKERLKQDLWLVIATQKRVHYAIDEEEFHEFEGRAERTRVDTCLGTTELVSNLVHCDIPYDLSFSKKSVERGKRVDFKVESARYRTGYSGIQLAQEAVYQSLMSLQPVYGHDKCTVLGLYPSNMASEYEPILCSMREPIRELVENNYNHIKQLSAKFERLSHDLPLDQVGQLIGGIGKAYFG
jgi:hypothetical protein